MATVNPGSLFHCAECGLSFRDPIPSREQLNLLYRKLPAKRLDYSACAPAAWAETFRILKARFDDNQSVRLLDIGPFDGGFLRQLPPYWTRLAIEPCDAARRELMSYDVEVIGEFLETVSSNYNDTCDVVCLFDVFEHLVDPTASLVRAISFLRPGGLLFVSTGNAEHWSWRLLGGEHWYLDPVGHIRFGGCSYFRQFSGRNRVPLTALRRISHQDCGWRQRAFEEFVTLYFGLRNSNRLGRVLARMIGCVPGIRQVRHKEYPPYTQRLRDHLLAVFQKPSH